MVRRHHLRVWARVCLWIGPAVLTFLILDVNDAMEFITCCLLCVCIELSG